MESVMLIKPGDAFTVNTIRNTGAAVSGGGTIYEEEEYTTNSSFNGSLSPWSFWYESTTIQNPVSTSALSDAEAAIGVFSAEVTFNSGSEWFATNIFTQSDSGNKIKDKQIVISAWIKNTTATMQFVYYVNGSVNGTYNIPNTSNAWQKVSWSVTLTSGQLSGAQRIIVGLKSTTGTADHCFIDGFSVKCPANLTDVALSSYITFSPSWNNAQIVSRLSESIILVFETGNNKNIGSEIISITNTGNDISRIDLADPLPYVPQAGDVVFVMLPNDMYSGGRYYTLDRVYDISVSSTIEMGYSGAEITLHPDDLVSKVKTHSIAHWRMIVTGECGDIFDGIVTGLSISKDEAKITATGFKSVMEKTPYVGYFASSPSVTIKTVLNDVFSATKLIKGSDLIIDRGDVISSAQIAAGGIGPLDFESSPQTMLTAIDEVLKLGPYDDTFDMLFVQIWSDRTPVLRRVRRSQSETSADWVIGLDCIVGGGTDYSVDRSQASTALYGTYSTVSGGQADTARVYNVSDTIKYGKYEKNLSTGKLTDAEVYLVLQNGVNNPESSESVGSLTLSGRATRWGTGIKMPVSSIRSGDVIFVPSLQNLLGVYTSGNVRGDFIVVGSTQYSSSKKTISVTPYGLPSTVEYMLNIITVE